MCIRDRHCMLCYCSMRQGSAPGLHQPANCPTWKNRTELFGTMILIALGSYYLDQSRCENVSSYHYEAAIAHLHSHAKSFGETDWATIAQLYRQLLLNNPNPFIELNYAIALYYDSQKQKAFDALHDLQQTFLDHSYLLHAALGKLYWQEGEYSKSNLHLTTALSLTNFQVEKDFVKKMLVKS